MCNKCPSGITGDIATTWCLCIFALFMSALEASFILGGEGEQQPASSQDALVRVCLYISTVPR